MAAASKLLANMVYYFKGMGLSIVREPLVSLLCVSVVWVSCFLGVFMLFTYLHAGDHDLRLGQKGKLTKLVRE